MTAPVKERRCILKLSCAACRPQTSPGHTEQHWPHVHKGSHNRSRSIASGVQAEVHPLAANKRPTTSRSEPLSNMYLPIRINTMLLVFSLHSCGTDTQGE